MALTGRLKKQGGYSIITDPAKSRPEEADTFTCFHCGTIVDCKPFQDGAAMAGLCSCCDKYICLNCVGKGCTPLERKLELQERRHQYEKLLQ
jgi:hypothetical protein